MSSAASYRRGLVSASSVSLSHVRSMRGLDMESPSRWQRSRETTPRCHGGSCCSPTCGASCSPEPTSLAAAATRAHPASMERPGRRAGEDRPAVFPPLRPSRTWPHPASMERPGRRAGEDRPAVFPPLRPSRTCFGRIIHDGFMFRANFSIRSYKTRVT